MLATGTINALYARTRYDQGDLWLTDLEGEPTGELLALMETWMGTPAGLVDLMACVPQSHPTVTRVQGGLFGDVIRVAVPTSATTVTAVLQRTHAWTMWGRRLDDSPVLEVPAHLWESTNLGMIGILSPAELRHASTTSHDEILWRQILHDLDQRHAEADAMASLIALAGREDAPTDAQRVL